jgi:hypothetical protein
MATVMETKPTFKLMVNWGIKEVKDALFEMNLNLRYLRLKPVGLTPCDPLYKERKVIFEIKGKKVNSKTTKRELCDFINEGFRERRAQDKIKKLKNSQKCRVGEGV